jgi:hypothetical protein
MGDLPDLPFLLLRGLVKTRDLETFEGPLLSEFRSSTGDIYLYSWCDTWEHGHRWLVFRVTARDLAMYLHGRLSLRKLIYSSPEPVVYIVDLDDDGKMRKVDFAPLDGIPAEYLPDDSAWAVGLRLHRKSASSPTR